MVVGQKKAETERVAGAVMRVVMRDAVRNDIGEATRCVHTLRLVSLLPSSCTRELPPTPCPPSTQRLPTLPLASSLLAPSVCMRCLHLDTLILPRRQ